MQLLSIAPMLDITDRHCRVFFRLFSPHLGLYTEMVHCGAILFGDQQRFLNFNAVEHPLAFQLGGSNPEQLAQASKIVEDAGFDEINLNVGCPSDRVQAGRFGACLMTDPDLVAECVHAMQQAVSIPVTVKNRLGVDDQDPQQALWKFILTVSATGCDEFIIHARKAWLKGLSPKDNRNIPPLDYDLVYQLKRDFPSLKISLNGGVETLAEAKTHLKHVDSVMIGRAPIDNPWMLAEVHRLFKQNSAPFQSRREIVLAYCQYIEAQLRQDVWLKHCYSPLMGLYKGQANAKLWRKTLAEECRAPDAGVDVILKVLEKMES